MELTRMQVVYYCISIIISSNPSTDMTSETAKFWNLNLKNIDSVMPLHVFFFFSLITKSGIPRGYPIRNPVPVAPECHNKGIGQEKG